MSEVNLNFEQNLEDIAKISAIPHLLNVICQTTGMGFAAVARVTEDKWLTCSVQDNVSFGLKPGDELQIKTTICDEVRQIKKGIVIDHVSNDPDFFNHPTPAMYGFQSYISVPIIKKDGSFFGTLCAIDPKPNKLDTIAVKGMFNLFADLISFHLNAIEQIKMSEASLLEERVLHKTASERQKIFTDELEKKVQERTHQLSEKNAALKKMNSELESFAFISSHDLQEPLRKIQTFSNMVLEKENINLSDTGKRYFEIIRNAAHRMQNLIKDLLSYSKAGMDERKFEDVDLRKIVDVAKQDLNEELLGKKATIEIAETCIVHIINFQFRQLFYNILSNSIKFSDPARALHISIKSKTIQGDDFSNQGLLQGKKYCHIRITDNGIGFEPQYNEQVFKIFKRLNNGSTYNGTGTGLAIVKKIVENHQGVITASGQLNKGATLDIYIPAVKN